MKYNVRVSTKRIEQETIEQTPFGQAKLRVIKNSNRTVQETKPERLPEVSEESVRTALGMDSRETARMTKEEAIRLLGGK